MKKLTSREKEMITLAIEEACDLKDYKEKGCYKILGDEMNAIKEKINYKETQAGNQIRRGFIMDSDGNQALNQRSWLSKKGFRDLYIGAHYYWAMFNPTTYEIVTYTEGDYDTIICKTKGSFNREIQSMKEFLKGYDKELHKEMLDNLKEYEEKRR